MHRLRSSDELQDVASKQECGFSSRCGASGNDVEHQQVSEVALSALIRNSVCKSLSDPKGTAKERLLS